MIAKDTKIKAKCQTCTVPRVKKGGKSKTQGRRLWTNGSKIYCVSGCQVGAVQAPEKKKPVVRTSKKDDAKKSKRKKG